MATPNAATTRKLAKAMRARTLWLDVFGRPTGNNNDRYSLVMLPPKRIGNAAHAFDARHPEFMGLRK